MNKKIIFSSIFLIIIIFIFVGYYYFNSVNYKLINLKKNNNELVYTIDNILKWKEKLKEDENRIESYATLGMAWKKLGDQTNNLIYYREALKVYQKAIDKTKRSNTLFLTNAAKMAIYLKEYNLAENYFKEAIIVSPGESMYYIDLAELYEYNLKKSKEEILAVFDDGIKKIINPEFLIKYKENYLEKVTQ